MYILNIRVKVNEHMWEAAYINKKVIFTCEEFIMIDWFLLCLQFILFKNEEKNI